MIHYTENSKISTPELLELWNEFSKIVGYKNNIQKSVAFYTLVLKYQKEEAKLSLVAEDASETQDNQLYKKQKQ